MLRKFLNYKKSLENMKTLVKSAKAGVGKEIAKILKKRDISQKEAASRLGVSQPDVSKLKHCKAKSFSFDRLFQFVMALNRKIVIFIKPLPPSKAPEFEIKAK